MAWKSQPAHIGELLYEIPNQAFEKGKFKNINSRMNMVNKMSNPVKTYPTIGVCGLDCGLCPRYYTIGTSRCPGCAGPDFFNKHPSCSFITCCVKKKNLEVCAECSDFPCSKFKSDEEYQQLKESSSYPSSKKVIPNLNFIKEHGIEKFMEQQKKRIKLLETMIENFDDGSSIEKATRKIKQNDVKNKAKILKAMINEVALKEVVGW